MEADCTTGSPVGVADLGSSPPRESAMQRSELTRQFIGAVMTSKTIRLWSEIRTFKTLYEV